MRRARARRGQISVEYVMIFGFAMMITIPFMFYFFFYTGGPSREVDANQATLVSRRIVDNAEVVYSLGDGARTTLKIYLPPSVIDSTIYGDHIVFKLVAHGGTTEVAYPSEVNISGTIPNSTGQYRIHLETIGNYVNISWS